MMDDVIISEVVISVPRSARDVRQGIKVDATATARAFVVHRFGWTDATVRIERQNDSRSTFRISPKGES